MNEAKQTCSICVLHSNVPGIDINDEGICSLCAKFKKFEQHEPKMKKYLQEEMENLFKKAKSKPRPYHALVLFSGGKDSTVLLKMAKEKYNLRTLAFSIIHPLVNEVASKNMESVANKLNVDLLKLFPDEEVYKKVVRHGILNGPKYGLGEFFGCDICTFFHYWLPIKYAMALDIPVILEGSDISQAGEITYWQAERVKAEASQGKRPFGRVHEMFADVLQEKYQGSIYEYNESEIINGRYPTIISPFTFMEYDYRKNFQNIENMGMESRKFRSIYTNCSAIPFFSYFTLKRFGCVPYIKHYAAEIRMGYPNLMQRSVTDQDAGDVLNKKMIETLMEEYKNVVLYVGKTRLNAENITEAEEKKLRGMAPNYLKLFGEEVCDVFLKDVLQITRFAEIFEIDLDIVSTWPDVEQQ
jgi:hypothetical protein